MSRTTRNMREFICIVFLSLIYKPGQALRAKFDKKAEVRFGNFLKISDGHILAMNGSVINNITVKSKNKCLMECMGEERCLSINLYSGQPNQLQCELLTWAGTAFHSHLKPKSNSQSLQLETACSPNPCQNGGDCLADAGGHQYSCSCTSNFEGDNCEFKSVADYNITVYTGDEEWAGTDAKVFIKLHGSQFKKEISSSKVQLFGDFEPRSVDTTMINDQLPNMESLSKITMSHDNTGSYAAWYLEKVIVDNKTLRMKYTFVFLARVENTNKEPIKDSNGKPIVTRY